MSFLQGIVAGSSMELWPDAVRIGTGVDRLADIRDRHIRELDHLHIPETPEERAEFARDLRDSFEEKIRLWIIPMTQEERESWQHILPYGAVLELGPAQMYQGREIIPSGLVPRFVVDSLIQRGDARDMLLLRDSLHNVDALCVSLRHEKALREVGIELHHRNIFVRIFTNFKFLAYVVVLIYSMLRVLPVMFVPEFKGSLWVLWTIDIVTALPYTWGILTMVTAGQTWKRLVGLVTTIVTFMAPYVYFASHGKHYPPDVIYIIIVLISSAFVVEGFKMWRDYVVARSLRERSLRIGDSRRSKVISYSRTTDKRERFIPSKNTVQTRATKNGIETRRRIKNIILRLLH
ncbi:hypothetical protein [Actinotignum urinale]|uniref:hypothetical protein n=1 Tax=Actinotignum urinale TaxID=190146 RepID=UPI000687D485|nr:hypothetical protein [Actinotignum urinale]MDY5159712.1 hypothetical protein [Actinotignum urinale]